MKHYDQPLSQRIVFSVQYYSMMINFLVNVDGAIRARLAICSKGPSAPPAKSSAIEVGPPAVPADRTTSRACPRLHRDIHMYM